MRSAPPVPSSAGWKNIFTIPVSSDSISLSRIAAPSAAAVWMSCPQACITPLFLEAKGSPVSSVSGSASVSARSATVLPLPAEPTDAVAAVPSSISLYSMPCRPSISARRAHVGCSSPERSGYSCSSRRKAVSIGSIPSILLSISIGRTSLRISLSPRRRRRASSRAT